MPTNKMVNQESTHPTILALKYFSEARICHSVNSNFDTLDTSSSNSPLINEVSNNITTTTIQETSSNACTCNCKCNTICFCKSIYCQPASSPDLAPCLCERLSKKHKSNEPNNDEYIGHPFNIGYLDFYGPFPIQGVGGIIYCLFYITRRGRIGFVEMVKPKSTSNILAAFQGWRLSAKQNGWSMERLQFNTVLILILA